MQVTIFPFITVVMPVRNEERFIETTLNQLLDQDYPSERFEIIVADGMSTDDTRKVVDRIRKKNKNVRIIDNPSQRSSSGRNIGFKYGKGDIFIVVDGHCYIPTNQLLKNIAKQFEQHKVDCLGRPQPLDPPDISIFQRAVALARGSLIGHGSNSLIYSSHEGFVSPTSHGAIYTRAVFNRIGYVDENFDACEDVDFNYRVEEAGFKSRMSPTLTIKYYPRENINALYRQMSRYGIGRMRFISKHPETFSFMDIIPMMFVLGFIMLFSISFILPVLTHLFLITIGLYFSIILSSSIILSFKHGFRYLFYLPSIYLTIHVGLGIGQLIGLRELFSRKVVYEKRDSRART